jgi:hypothetical protein
MHPVCLSQTGCMVTLCHHKHLNMFKFLLLPEGSLSAINANMAEGVLGKTTALNGHQISLGCCLHHNSLLLLQLIHQETPAAPTLWSPKASSVPLLRRHRQEKHLVGRGDCWLSLCPWRMLWIQQPEPSA